MIPYLNLLSARLSSPASISTSKSTSVLEITVAALVPREKAKANSPLKLWILKGRVYDSHASIGNAVGTVADEEISAGESVRLKAARWCMEAEERAYAGLSTTELLDCSPLTVPHACTGIDRSKERLYCVVNPAGGKGLAKKVWEEAVKPMLDAAGCAYDIACASPAHVNNVSTRC